MGALHEGHLHLLKQSTIDNDYTLCSIYVNPTQFNDKKDLKNYPRDSRKDINTLKANNCDILFMPDDSTMYASDKIPIEYNFTDCFSKLEGAKRPGHFLGVVTIVHKLFTLIQPDKAYFGEKDYQQLWIINLFVKEYKLPIKIIPCKTIRNNIGLALSSRNIHLTEKEQKVAVNLFRALQKLKQLINSLNNEESSPILKKNKLTRFKNNALSIILGHKLIKLDYFEIIEIENFSFTEHIDFNKKYRALIAAYIGKIRLIDNIAIN